MMYYFFQYIILILILNVSGIIQGLTGQNIMTIPSMFELCNSYPLVYILVSYLIVRFQIIRKMDNRNEFNYSMIRKKLMISCTIFNIVFYTIYEFFSSNYIINLTNTNLLLFCGSTLLFLYFLKSSKEKNKNITDMEIKKYYDEKNGK